MFCYSCGAKIEDGNKFCSQCGTPVRTAAPAVTEPVAEPAAPVVVAEPVAPVAVAEPVAEPAVPVAVAEPAAPVAVAEPVAQPIQAPQYAAPQGAAPVAPAEAPKPSVLDSMLKLCRHPLLIVITALQAALTGFTVGSLLTDLFFTSSNLSSNALFKASDGLQMLYIGAAIVTLLLSAAMVMTTIGLAMIGSGGEKNRVNRARAGCTLAQIGSYLTALTAVAFGGLVVYMYRVLLGYLISYMGLAGRISYSQAEEAFGVLVVVMVLVVLLFAIPYILLAGVFRKLGHNLWLATQPGTPFAKFKVGGIGTAVTFIVLLAVLLIGMLGGETVNVSITLILILILLVLTPIATILFRAKMGELRHTPGSVE